MFSGRKKIFKRTSSRRAGSNSIGSEHDRRNSIFWRKNKKVSVVCFSILVKRSDIN